MLPRRLANNRQSSSLANSFRRKRYEIFRSLIAPYPRPLTILDVGGEENFWKQMGVKREDGLEITLLNLQAEPVSMPFVKSLAGDARAMPEFPDKSFDIVFSNSVIEHVGSWSDQQLMAKEVMRIGKRFFVQTPARSFPIEPHFLFPFFAVLPDELRVYLVRHFNLGWYKKIPERAAAVEFLNGFRLLDKRQMAVLFPGAELKTERFLGLSKSYLATSLQFDV